MHMQCFFLFVCLQQFNILPKEYFTVSVSQMHSINVSNTPHTVQSYATLLLHVLQSCMNAYFIETFIQYLMWKLQEKWKQKLIYAVQLTNAFFLLKYYVNKYVQGLINIILVKSAVLLRHRREHLSAVSPQITETENFNKANTESTV